MPPPLNPIPPALRDTLNRLHATLLALHKELLDHDRRRYEAQHGSMGAPGNVLQLVINDPWFAWLRPLTATISQIDEFLASRTPRPPAEADALIAQTKTLLTPAEEGTPFQRDYFRDLHESPDVASAHGHWRTLLQTL